MSLSIQSLKKQYTPGGPWALDGVDLEIGEGEFVAILGPSGAGKSTLIRCVNRLVEPSAGKIAWDGRDITALDKAGLREHRRRIGMIFQEFHLIDRLDVLTNVLVGRFGSLKLWQPVFGRYPDRDVELALEALERVGLAAYAERRARELSGGQRQRVAIARALTQQPRLILGDEPVSNLDPATSHGIMALLADVNRRDGITLMLNLHSVELARRYAGRIVGMANGKVVFDGMPDALTPRILKAIYGDFPAGLEPGEQAGSGPAPSREPAVAPSHNP